MPNVSIIIPVHNCEKTIRRSLRSIKNQTYKDFEVIVINNNCEDETINIVKEFENDFLLTIVDCKEPGIVAALNTGLRQVKSPWIARQDGDDFWFPEKLEKQIKFLNDNKDVSILGTQISLVNENGDKEEIGTFGNKVKYPTDDNEIKLHLLYGQNPLCHPSVIFSSRLLDIIGGYEKLFPFAEDLHLWCKAIPHFKFANLSETLVEYTQTKNPKYDARIPVIIGDYYYNLYKLSGLVEGEKKNLVYNWQTKENGHRHSGVK